VKRLELGLVLGLAVVLAAAFVLRGCAPAEEASLAPMKIGISLPLTGSKAQFGTMDWLSIQMAYADFDVTERCGRQISFIVEDNRGDPAIADSAGRKSFTLDNVDIMIGGYSSPCGVTQAAAPNDLRVPLLCNGRT